jgi:uncharacterized membrane protein
MVGVVPFPACVSGVPSRPVLQPSQDRRADEERHQQRRDRRARRAERDVVEEIEQLDVVRQRDEKMIEHDAVFRM